MHTFDIQQKVIGSSKDSQPGPPFFLTAQFVFFPLDPEIKPGIIIIKKSLGSNIPLKIPNIDQTNQGFCSLILIEPRKKPVLFTIILAVLIGIPIMGYNNPYNKGWFFSPLNQPQQPRFLFTHLTPWKFFTAGTYSHHPWKETSKMIWTKPPFSEMFQPLIFRGVIVVFFGGRTPENFHPSNCSPYHLYIHEYLHSEDPRLKTSMASQVRATFISSWFIGILMVVY